MNLVDSVNFVRTVLGFSATVLAAVLYLAIGILAFVLSFLGLKKPMSWVVYKLAQFWAHCVIIITGCAMEVEGREHIPPKGKVCFMSNHGSIFDAVLALAYIGRPFGFIAKKELSLVPLLNLWILLLGGLYIDRKNMRKALETINLGIRRIQKGGRMLIFPEGTRSKGRGLLPFKSGAIRLATHSLAPIVPIAISGSYEVFEKNYRVNPGPVRVVFCPPIMIADMSPDDRKHHLADQVRDIIQAALNRE